MEAVADTEDIWLHTGTAAQERLIAVDRASPKQNTLKVFRLLLLYVWFLPSSTPSFSQAYARSHLCVCFPFRLSIIKWLNWTTHPSLSFQSLQNWVLALHSFDLSVKIVLYARSYCTNNYSPQNPIWYCAMNVWIGDWHLLHKYYFVEFGWTWISVEPTAFLLHASFYASQKMVLCYYSTGLDKHSISSRHRYLEVQIGIPDHGGSICPHWRINLPWM